MWRKYLEELRKRAQRKHRGPRSRIRREPKIDELVLLKGNCPRNTWRMRRIDRLIRDENGICRSAVVRIANGKELVRAWDTSILWWFPTEDKGTDHARLGSVADIANGNRETITPFVESQIFLLYMLISS
uniref:DUF5641 domain-containing protein n=1 Tax=Loa loa TaxID=7209 RepID=A0A1I7V8N2_LOALO